MDNKEISNKEQVLTIIIFIILIILFINFFTFSFSIFIINPLIGLILIHILDTKDIKFIKWIDSAPHGVLIYLAFIFWPIIVGGEIKYKYDKYKDNKFIIKENFKKIKFNRFGKL